MKTSLAVLAAATLALTACSASDEPAKEATVTKTAAPTAEPAVEEEPEVEETGPVEGEDGVIYYDEEVGAIVEYGSTWTWPNGLSITVEEDGTYKTGSQYKATMKNGTNGPVDTSTAGVTVECGLDEADWFYDGEAPERPSVTVLPGKSKSWTEAWDAKGDCIYSIQPDLDQESVHFVSADYPGLTDGH